MNKVSNAERKHIVFIGKRNVGKSSLINAFAGQEMSIVSNTAGTTTDPVRKAMELLPFGPVVLVDTAGIDDIGELGEKRVSKTMKAISSADFVLFVIDATECLDEIEKKYISNLINNKIAFAFVLSKIDLGINKNLIAELNSFKVPVLETSAINSEGIHQLKERVSKLIPDEVDIPLVSDFLEKGDIIMLVVPIDPGAPKGRIIKPQVQALREALDGNAITIVVQTDEIKEALGKLKEPPKLVVTDSQAIAKVSEDVPEEIPLTTFSILMARSKGELSKLMNGINEIDKLNDGDRVLISEACTHHAQKDDIGRVKIPRWLKSFSKKNIEIDIVAGRDYPEDLSKYNLVIHCGACMITRTEMLSRIKQAELNGIPIVNYGLIISFMHGAIPRVLKPFV
ncbi:MAG: [FeFe] hydrogenase H-cluster maturation GTPase HydF [Chlorobi bacterium]|nr:[FeFe] hydrogenase H-cluster maturation GTPase HydF [Chlorobiota bacterium]